MSIPTCMTSPTSYLFSKFLKCDSGKDNSRPALVLSDLAKWRTTYGPLARKSPAWEPSMGCQG
jgi:hypothetical protein